MILWNDHQSLGEEFLTQHHDLVLYEAFHRVMAFLLYPPRCACKDPCRCDSIRAKIILSLNLDFYHKLQEKNEGSEQLCAARFLLKIPDESYCRKHYTDGYPTWLIKENFGRKGLPFKLVDHLMWTLLRISKTHELSIFHTAKTSMQEAIEWIFGNTPVKTKAGREKSAVLGGQDAYTEQFKLHKQVAHFIVALEFLEKERGGEPSILFSWDQPNQIERFFSLSHGFREKFLLLYTPNTKKKNIFLEEEILPLPLWVKSDGVDLLIEPFEEKLQEINAPYEELMKSRSA